MVGIPGRIVLLDGKPVPASSTLVDMPDPQAFVIQQLAERITALEAKLAELGNPTQPSRPAQINAAIFDDAFPVI